MRTLRQMGDGPHLHDVCILTAQCLVLISAAIISVSSTLFGACNTFLSTKQFLICSCLCTQRCRQSEEIEADQFIATEKERQEAKRERMRRRRRRKREGEEDMNLAPQCANDCLGIKILSNYGFRIHC